MSSEDRIARDNYDRGIVPAETAARMEREKENYKHTPEQESDNDLDTASGYTMDNEGLVNNFAIEPEMYYEEPGDLKQKEEAEDAARQQELAEVNQTEEDGKLTAEEDRRGKGTGVI